MIKQMMPITVVEIYTQGSMKHLLALSVKAVVEKGLLHFQ